MDSVKKCSQLLRAMAVNSGIEIDDIYRNVNGISFQMASMESAYQGKTIMKPATQLFTEIVQLFRENNKEYHDWLNKAKDMANAKRDGEATIRQAHGLCTTNPAKHQMILDEAHRITETLSISVEDAFFAYAKDKTGIPSQMLVDYLQKAADYCHLKQPLLGMTDAKAVHNAQKRLLRENFYVSVLEKMHRLFVMSRSSIMPLSKVTMNLRKMSSLGQLAR